MRFQHFIAAFALAALLLSAACSPIVTTRGNLLSKNKIAQIQPAASTKADVESFWGPPTTVASFDPNIWYYIGETTTQSGIFEPEVEKRQVIRVTFDETDKVAEVALLDNKLARDIEFVDRKTQTAGKEYTVVQQFIGNLGKFNKEKK
jgi:outer membrane protein assembly factor BamE (lipoprotein component of BamABCDE complex)